MSRKPASALERYLAHLVNERRLSAHTVAAYARDNASLAALAGERDLDSLAAPDIRRFIAMLHSKGLAPRSLGRTLSSWRGFYEWRIREKAIAANPCAGVRSPKMAKPLPGMLSPEEAIRLVTFEEPDSPFALRDRALFELIYSSGLRVSEITGTDVDAIDLDEAQVRVLGKGAKTRIVPVGQGAIDALVRWLPERAKHTRPGEPALFVDAKGQRITPRQVQVLIKARAAAAGLTVDVHPHMLRHSFASHVLQSSGDLRAVQEMLGHASIASTQVYTHLDFQHLAKVYDAAHPRARKKDEVSATTLTPVTVLTGFLGSGKSTLLNRVLHDTRYADTAVIVNEFGDIPIDHALVRRASENVIVLSGGCICCRVAGDLVQALRDLHFKRAANEVPAFRRAVIETTGLADPAPLLATLIEMPLVAARYALSGVVTTVDGVHGARALDEHPEAVKQAAVADRIVVTKSDLAAAPALDALESRLAALNPAAPRIRARSGDVDASWLFDIGLHRHDGSRPDATGWLGANEWRSFAQPASRGPHDERIRSFTWTAPGPVSWDALEAALDTLLELRGERILRLKGLVNTGDTGPVAIHAVQHTLYPPAKLAEWPDNDRRTRLVFITRDLEASAIAPILDSFTSTSSAS